MDPATGEYNRPFLTAALELVSGYRRLQGIVYRKGDPRFEGGEIISQCRAKSSRNAGRHQIGMLGTDAGAVRILLHHPRWSSAIAALSF
jgi:hypothetical protein